MAASCTVAPLRRILGSRGIKTALAPPERAAVFASVGQGDASCSRSLNILAGNISDAFSSFLLPLSSFSPSCFHSTVSFSLFLPSVVKRVVAADWGGGYLNSVNSLCCGYKHMQTAYGQ